MERLGFAVVPVGEGRRPDVVALLFAVSDEFLGHRRTGGAAGDVLEESPKTVEEQGKGNRCSDKEDGDDNDADYLPCFA